MMCTYLKHYHCHLSACHLKVDLLSLAFSHKELLCSFTLVVLLLMCFSVKGPDGMPHRADRESSVLISGPSSQCPAPALSSQPLPDTPRRRCICDISTKRRIYRFEVLIKKRILHVQTARCMRRAANKRKATPTSQAFFKIDVPMWSDYFSTDSSCDVPLRKIVKTNLRCSYRRGHYVSETGCQQA